MIDQTHSSVPAEHRLTLYSHGAGCGCKIAPDVLKEILKTNEALPQTAKLLVGSQSSDDAAVYDMENGMAIISTTDFFMPIVDDAFDFGRIAAANSISDVYAMGGIPLMAIAILGWPVQKIPAALAKKVVEGGRAICADAGIPLAGGHSIDSPEPVFGLAVTGMVPLAQIKKNNTAEPGDHLLLTKPLGVGILSTAQKRGLLPPEMLSRIVSQMTTLNKEGADLSHKKCVTAMTDVTGFGLLGHLLEMAEGSGLCAELCYDQIPRIPGVEDYIRQQVYPDGCNRNWNSYGNKVAFDSSLDSGEAIKLLSDPQTNGGLLISVRPEGLEEVRRLLAEKAIVIGKMTTAGEKTIMVQKKEQV